MKTIFTLALLTVSVDAHAQDEGCYNRLTQDLNCNVIDEVDEVPVDLDDPLCVSNVDEFDNPYPNADYYVEYFAFGCQNPISWMDLDSDGFIGKRPDKSNLTALLGWNWNRHRTLLL